MAKRRAISREDKALEPKNLPHLYQTLVPLLPERHGSLRLGTKKAFDFAARANAVPLTAEEFPIALRHYPIVFSLGDNPSPLALVGAQLGKNDFVTNDGTWRAGTYIPAYLRRYPFAYVREDAESTRNILCADLSSTLFTPNEQESRPLFENGESAQVINDALTFCNRFEIAMERTRAATKEFLDHDLIGASTVSITRGGKVTKVEGFQTISEEKLRELSDDVLASFVRRGLSGIMHAHFMSLANFSDLGSSV
ncbi:MAG: SapC family protein [Pseudomonadota bacterium]